MMKIEIDIEKDIGQQMREIRERLGFSCADVAQYIGVSQASISYYESNKRAQSINVLRKFLQFSRRFQRGKS
jgi:transcriptional regulator with XRE-family HTH domain